MISGDEVSLKIDSAGLVAADSSGEYLGLVEPRHGLRLIKLMKGGNRYSTAVVSSTEETLTVIIREIEQAPQLAGRLSFPRSAEEVRPRVDERVYKHDAESEEGGSEESGYTIIGGDEVEVMPEESSDSADDMTRDEE
jgi:hypothetical protein